MRLSYSKLSKFDSGGPSALLTKYESSNAMNFGSLVDDMITNPDEINDKYYVSTVEEPTASLKVLINNIKDNESVVHVEGNKLIVIEAEIINIIANLGLWSKIVDVNKLNAKWNNDHFTNYLFHYIKSKGKTLVSFEDFSLAQTIVKSLKSNQFTQIYLNETEDIDIKYQVKIKFDYDKFKFVGILDIIHINHKLKQITPIDLKTGENGSFMKSWRMFRYDIQFGLYTEAIKSYVKQYYPDYEIMPMLYIYVNKNKPNKPSVFSFDKAWENAAKNGTRYTRGWLELSENVIWHYDNNLFDYSKEMYENGSVNIKFYD